MLITSKFTLRRRIFAASLLGLVMLTGCGLARSSRWARSSAVPVAPPVEPGGGYLQREYSPAPIEPTPAERPMPIFPNDPPPPSTSEYLAPPGQPGPASRPTYSERPGLITPQNARRLPSGSERPAAASTEVESRPSFEDGPVASHSDRRTIFTRFQQVDSSDPR